MKKVFEFEWDEQNLSEGWFNKDNLKSCLYSSEHTKEDLLKVKDVDVKLHRVPELDLEILPDDCDYIPVDDEGFCVRYDGVQFDGRLYLWESIKSLTIKPTGKWLG